MIGNMKRRLLAVAGLAAGIFFSHHLQAEMLGPPSAPLWLRYPTISPDGKSIAFSFEGHLFIVPSAGGSAQSLTTGPAHDTRPVWSPDGKLIAYASDRYGQRGHPLQREQRLARAFVLPGVTPCEDLDGLSARAEKMPEQSGFTRSGGFAIETSQNLGEYFAIFYNIIREA